MSLPQSDLAEAVEEEGEPERRHEERRSPSWFTSGRSTSALDRDAERDHDRERRRASASQNGICSISRTSVSAAKSTIAPCAKLKTPEALKISTKPSATSE